MRSIADGPNGKRQARARERIEQQTRHLRNARLAEQAMPLTRHYGPRPLLAIPLAEYLARRCAA